MALFLSTLSLFLLVLFHGSFTAPIIEHRNSSSTLIDNLTTESEFNTRSFPVDETSPLSDVKHQHLFDEHIRYNMSTSVNNSTEAQTVHSVRSFATLLTSSPSSYQHDGRYLDELSLSATESTTLQSTTDTFTRALRNLDSDMSDELTTDFMLLSTSTPSAETEQDEPESDQSSGQQSETKVEPTPKLQAQFQRRIKPRMKSVRQPETTSKSDLDSEQESQPADEVKPQRKSELKSKTKQKVGYEWPTNSDHNDVENGSSTAVPSQDSSQGENSNEPTAPTAFFDQEALKNISNPFDNSFYLDDNNTLIVTDSPRRFSTTTIGNAKLNQGKKPLHVEEKESHN